MSKKLSWFRFIVLKVAQFFGLDLFAENKQLLSYAILAYQGVALVT